MKRSWPVLGLLVLLSSSCKKKDDPADTVQPPAAQPPTNPQPQPPSGSLNLEIYTDDLHQGGAFEYPGGGNQDLAFNDTSNPAVGSACMRYGWNGLDTSSLVQHIFVGVDLMHTGDLSTYASTPGKDLRSGNYTQVSFDARGGLSADVVVKVEVADDGLQSTPAPCIVLSATGLLDDSTPGNPVASCTNKAALLSTWQSYSLNVSSSDLTSVKDYFKATFIYKGSPATTGSGGTIFFDQILYKP